jgi:hypothetical protein
MPVAVKQPRSYNDMAGTGLQPLGGILRMDASTDLQALWVGAQGFARRALVVRTELDNVPASERIAAILLRIVLCRLVTLKIGLQALTVFLEAAANDLLHFTFMEVNAWTETGHS